MRNAITLALLLLVGCGPSLTPRQRYIQALNHRLEGNSKAYTNGLIALAHDEPDSRAGRRARATLQGGGLMTSVAVIGVLGAIAIPNFLSFQSRAKQSEAKTNLRGLYVAQQSYFAEHQRYCTTFEECGFSPEPGARYIYMLGPEELTGGDGIENPGLLFLRAAQVLERSEITPRVTRDRFVAVAIGDPDEDGEVDVWVINQDNDLENVVNDFD